MEYSSALVAETFVKQFYDMLARNPSELHRFYTEDSSFSHAEHPSEPTCTVKGVDAIRKRVAELNLLNAHVDLSEGAYDVQDSFSSVAAILVVVTGRFSLNNAQPSPFTHTFVLAKPEGATNGASYYVKNSVFRQQSIPAERIFVSAPVAESAPVEVVAPSAVVVTPEPVIVAPEPPVAAPISVVAPAAVPAVEPAVASSVRLSFADMAKRNSSATETMVLPSVRPKVSTAGAAVAKPAEPVVPKEKEERKHAANGVSGQNQNAHNSMYIKQVTSKVTEEALREYFSLFGTITRCDMQVSKGFAFIDFSTRDSLLSALGQKEAIVVCGVTLRVEERSPKGPGRDKSNEDKATVASAKDNVEKEKTKGKNNGAENNANKANASKNAKSGAGQSGKKTDAKKNKAEVAATEGKK